MGMTEQEFSRCSTRFFRLKLHGMRKQQRQQYRNDWERVRWQTAVLLAPYSKQQIDPRKLLTFEWEKPPSIAEQVEKYKAIFDKLTPIPIA